MDDLRSRYDNVSFLINTPDGKANIIIVEEERGKIWKIFYNIGKAGHSVNAWSHALCEVITDAIHRGASINDMIEILSNITSSRPVFNSSGMVCRSGPEALYLALLQYRNMNKEIYSRVELPEDYRPPRMRGGR